MEPSFRYKFYPKKAKVVNWHGPGISYDGFFDGKWAETDRRITLSYRVKFQSSAFMEMSYTEKFTQLFFDTDVTFTDQTPISKGGYDYRTGRVFFRTNTRKRLNGSFSASAGGYYNGFIVNTVSTINYRAQPWGIFSVVYDQNEIRLPNGRSASLHLIGPRFEFSFVRNVYLTTFFQYNTQANNFNINARFQWRFKPMSDLYLVYTDNYDQTLSVKNRAVVLKLIWWLTM
ncbi:MAG: hypothetical protein JKX84_11315 [Flavobacteriales bacterium]|nr:hypothetical protein [Flavobacteriales bacterium]